MLFDISIIDVHILVIKTLVKIVIFILSDQSRIFSEKMFSEFTLILKPPDILFLANFMYLKSSHRESMMSTKFLGEYLIDRLTYSRSFSNHRKWNNYKSKP
jgi:hypothetical protein